MGIPWCSLGLFQNFSCGQQATITASCTWNHWFEQAESLVSLVLWATSECALFLVLSYYLWSHTTNILYFCFLQMSANDCEDPPDYWTIHGLWYIVDCFNFNLERKIFIPKCLGLFFFQCHSVLWLLQKKAFLSLEIQNLLWYKTGVCSCISCESLSYRNLFMWASCLHLSL